MKNYICLSILLLLPFYALPQDGELDLSFNGDGKFSYLNKNAQERVRDVVRQNDGKLILAGNSHQNGQYQGMLIRLDESGNPDLKFGDQGLVLAEGLGSSIEGGVALDGDARILICGTTNIDDVDNVAVRRFLEDGRPDLSFGDSGIAHFPTPMNGTSFNFIAVQAGGKILVGGNIYNGGSKAALVRFNANGTPDYNFGDSALALFDYPNGAPEINRYLMKPDGGIIGIGQVWYNSHSYILFLQCTAAGEPDVSFGSNGQLRVIMNEPASGAGLTRLSDGRILGVGYVEKNGLNNFAMVRLLADGTLDQTFGVNGIASAPILNGDATAKSVHILGDGKILVAGDADGIWNRDLAVARFNSDGSLDNSFSYDGFVTKNMGSGYDYVTDAVLQPNGRLVVAGYSYNSYPGSSVSSYDFSAARFLGGPGTIGMAELASMPPLEVYPNPADDHLEIGLSEFPLSLTLYDQQGKEVKRLHRDPWSGGTMETAALAAGSYLLKIDNQRHPPHYVKVMICHY